MTSAAGWQVASVGPPSEAAVERATVTTRNQRRYQIGGMTEHHRFLRRLQLWL